MAMGYSAMAEEVIEWSEVQKLDLDVIGDIQKVLKKDEMLLDELARSVVFGLVDDFEKEGKNIAKLYELVEKLKVDFKEKYDLSLTLDFHDVEYDGDTYDEVDGAFFRLGGVYEMTPAAKKFKEIADFDTKYWVHFG